METCKICNRLGCIAQLCLDLNEKNKEWFYNIPHNNDTDLILVKELNRKAGENAKWLYNWFKENNLFTEEHEKGYKNWE